MDFDFSQPVDSIEKVPEQFRPLYSQAEDGQFKVAGDYQGVVEAVTGLNRSLKAARAEAKAKGDQKVDLSPLKDYGEDPATIAQNFNTKVEELQNQLAKGDDAKMNLDKIKEDMAKAQANERQQYQQREQALQNQLYGLMVKNEATNAIASEKGIPDLLMPFIENQVKVVEEDGQFKVFVIDEQGDRRYSGITGAPMTIKELVSEMKANEKFGRLFESDLPEGGGHPPGPSRKPAPKNEPLTANQKIAAGLQQGSYRRERR